MATKPKTLKFVLKGEVVIKTIQYETESGEVLEYDEIRNILVPSKKNQQTPMVSKAGKGYLLPSEQFRKWKEEHKEIFDSWNVELYNRGISLPIVRFKAKFIFYFPDNKRRDLFNKALTIEDSLKEHGIILDDCVSVVNKYNVEGYINRDRPRTELYITIIEHGSKEYNIDVTPASYYLKQREKKAIQKRIQRAKKSSS